MKKILEENRIKFDKISKEIGLTDKEKEIVKQARTYVYIRTFRTDILSNIFANYFPLFTEIAKRNNLELSDVIQCLPNEVSTFNFPSKNEIRKRSKAIIVRGYEEKLYYLEGNDAEKMRNKLISSFKKDETEDASTKTTIIKGNIANKGRVQGRVRILLDNSDLHKLKAGEILVSPMTTPDFVPAMEKASAFVTDEGGIMCHAAIVSREMKKPCIVGTKIATKILKDNQLVEVDADKGIVNILK